MPRCREDESGWVLLSSGLVGGGPDDGEISRVVCAALGPSLETRWRIRSSVFCRRSERITRAKFGTPGRGTVLLFGSYAQSRYMQGISQRYAYIRTSCNHSPALQVNSTSMSDCSDPTTHPMPVHTTHRDHLASDDTFKSRSLNSSSVISAMNSSPSALPSPASLSPGASRKSTLA